MTKSYIAQYPRLIFWAGLLVLILGSMAVVRNLPQLDFIIWLQANRTFASTRFFQIVSDSVNIFSLGLPFLFAVASEFDKTSNKTKSRLSFVYLGVSVGVAGLISYLFKTTTLVLRPYEVEGHIMQLSVGGGFSFPSGHTTEAFASATALSFLFPNWKSRVIFLCWAALVGFSRVYLGVHYPFDVLGGMAIGISTSFAFHWVFRKKTKVFAFAN